MIMRTVYVFVCFFFFFNDTATTEIYTLSLHDALPISGTGARPGDPGAGRFRDSSSRAGAQACAGPGARSASGDRKSTRLNSSHDQISYAVFCLKKKKTESAAHASKDAQLSSALTLHPR